MVLEGINYHVPRIRDSLTYKGPNMVLVLLANGVTEGSDKAPSPNIFKLEIMSLEKKVS